MAVEVYQAFRRRCLTSALKSGWTSDMWALEVGPRVRGWNLCPKISSTCIGWGHEKCDRHELGG